MGKSTRVEKPKSTDETEAFMLILTALMPLDAEAQARILCAATIFLGCDAPKDGEG